MAQNILFITPATSRESGRSERALSADEDGRRPAAAEKLFIGINDDAVLTMHNRHRCPINTAFDAAHGASARYFPKVLCFMIESIMRDPKRSDNLSKLGKVAAFRLPAHANSGLGAFASTNDSFDRISSALIPAALSESIEMGRRERRKGEICARKLISK